MGTSIGNSVTEQFEAKLIRIRTLSKTTRDFRFRRLDGSGIQFEPGEFFRFSFSDDQGKFERPYSLCDFTDGADDELDLLISVVDNGRASRYLFNCEEGINTRVTGPYGRLVIPRILPMRLFLVATSVGLAPFLPMLRPLEMHMVDSGLEVILLLGARDRSEFLYRNELLAFSDKYPAFLWYSVTAVKAGTFYLMNVIPMLRNRLTALNPMPVRTISCCAAIPI